MTDHVQIRGVECFGQHGVFGFDRRDGQVFVVAIHEHVVSPSAQRRRRTTRVTVRDEPSQFRPLVSGVGW